MIFIQRFGTMGPYAKNASICREYKTDCLPGDNKIRDSMVCMNVIVSAGATLLPVAILLVCLK